MKPSLKIALFLTFTGIVLIGFIFIAHYYNSQFSTKKWCKTNGISAESKFSVTHFPNREAILDDLLATHELKGKTYKQICTLLGPYDGLTVDSTARQWTIIYEVLVDYEWDIDPRHTINLEITFPLRNGKRSPDACATGSYVDDYHAGE